MKFCLITCSIFLIGKSLLWGKVSHLLVTNIGDGVYQSDQEGNANTLSRSTFLPLNTKLSVRSKSGIETLAAGYQFRFGSSTTFKCDPKSIELYNGSIFIRSRKISNSIEIKGPEVKMQLSGAGTCLIDVEPNGGFKCVGMLGKINFSMNEGRSVSILSGELVFTNLAENKFSDKLVVDMNHLLETSFLISGFSNSQSFLNSLQSVSESQKLVLDKTYNATVGRAKSAGSFEIIQESYPQKKNAKPFLESLNLPLDPKGYKMTSSSPLEEFLGRKPKRVPASESFPSINSTNINNAVEKMPSVDLKKRPFPSRLLRGQ